MYSKMELAPELRHRGHRGDIVGQLGTWMSLVQAPHGLPLPAYVGLNAD